MKTCPCCHQPVTYLPGIEYAFDDICFSDGEFKNDLPHRMAIVTFSDGAKMPAMLSRITEQFLNGQKFAKNTVVKPVSFKF